MCRAYSHCTSVSHHRVHNLQAAKTLSQLPGDDDGKLDQDEGKRYSISLRNSRADVLQEIVEDPPAPVI
jgi:hypothetical protein